MTRSAATIAVLLAAAGTATAQDSVTSSGLSDALSPYASAGQQGANYVVDLAAFNTSWGTEFGIAPLLKTTQTDVLFNNNLGSAQTISRGANYGVAPLGGNFMVWNGVDGGINAAAGQSASTVNPPASVTRFTAGIDDFGTGYNGIIGAAIEFDQANPSRLFVTRRHIAQSANEAVDGSNAALGGLAATKDGDFFYRADGFGQLGPDVYLGQNIFRTNVIARNSATTNLLGATGAGLDATDWLIQEDTATIPCPANIPGTNVLGVVDFNGAYRYGSAFGSITTAAPLAHLDAGAGVTNNRGTTGQTSRFAYSPNGVATYGIIGTDGAAYNYINTWSVDATGAIAGSPIAFTFPGLITDNDASSSFTFNSVAWPAARPYSYYSQTSFNGGIGQIGMGADQQGRGLAAFYYGNGTFNNPDNFMVATRFDPAAADPTAAAEFGVVAWTYYDAVVGSPTENMYLGKDITDGAGGVIGKLVPLDAVTGGVPFGPSFSPPSIDSAGNIWFQSSVALYGRVDANGDGVVDALDDVDLNLDGILDSSDTDGALIRAVYDPNNAGGPAWELEKVLELGTSVTGSNSGVAWRIDFMGTADSNSLSSGTFFSNNASEKAFNGFDVSGVDTSDSRTNGGVVVNASITYDVDGDGTFDTAGGIDQDYNALLYIGNLNATNPADPCLAIDFNGDGILDNGDIGAFVTAFLTGNLSADINGDGILDNGDIGAFVQLFLGCAG
ncbi:MAG: hypothetical protein ACI89L_001609 [Phycisphaerales bacterium]|jgi:hypothetical protein